MNQQSIQKYLSALPLGEIRHYETITSTNDEALVWATKGAPDLSLIIADEQTAGRGRLNRTWFTPKDSAIAMSLILRPTGQTHLSRTVGLAALSIADACLTRGLKPQIKWPNDILLNGKKVSGILIESVWTGTEVDCMVIGMGINVAKESTPPDHMLKFPATSMEAELGTLLERSDMVRDILTFFIKRREHIHTDAFLQDWEKLLAYRGEEIQIVNNEATLHKGILLGLNDDGAMKLFNPADQTTTIVQFGEVSLRPVL
jgi:BirA family biotin operon repressor/biotin-[acetyl-CoA-carboxylase] ligase